jgi:cell division cycle 2-like protein
MIERGRVNDRDRERMNDRDRERERARERDRDRERDWRARNQQRGGRDSEREPGEIVVPAGGGGGRREEGEFKARDHHHREQSVSLPNKRKFTPIVWDLEQGQKNSSRSAERIAPTVSSKFGPSPSVRRQQHPVASRSSSPPSPRKSTSTALFVESAPTNSVTSPGTSSAKKASPVALLGLGRDLSTPGIEQKGSEIRDEDDLDRKTFLSSSSSSQETTTFKADVAVSHSVNKSNGEREESQDVQMLDVVRVSTSPGSEGAPEPGQVLPDSPLPVVNDDNYEMETEKSPAPATIAASRWAEDPQTPQHNSSTPSRGPPKRAKKSVSLDSENRDQEASTSPEPGEYRQDKLSNSGGRISEDGEEYERELNKKELQELDEDEGIDDEEIQQPELDSDMEAPAHVPVGPPHRAIDMLKGCRSVDEFERLNKIDEGTYGVVFRARNKQTGEIVALKKVKMEKERGGFPMTSLREINVLLSFHHRSVVDVKEVVVGNNLDSIFMVMEYMEHDLKGLMETMKQPFSQSEVKCLMLQLFDGVKYLHDNWVLHRDLKTSNLLLNNHGELKICDFGLARQYGSPLKPYTHMVVTLWYRAPELLLGAKEYSTAIDMWSLGCIMAEFLAKEPLFNGKSEIDQIDKIFKTLGTPSEKIWPDSVKLPGFKCNFVRQPYNRLREKFPPTAFAGRPTLSESGFDLLNRLLTYDPQKRITADEALNHEWFREVPLPKAKEFMPTFPARSEHERRMRRLMKSPDPLEEQRRREARQAEVGSGGLFG